MAPNVDPTGATSLTLQLGVIALRGVGCLLSSVANLHHWDIANDAEEIYYEFISFTERSGIRQGVLFYPNSLHQLTIERKLKNIKRLCTNLHAIRNHYLERDCEAPEGRVVPTDDESENACLSLGSRAYVPTIASSLNLNFRMLARDVSESYNKIVWNFTNDGRNLKELLQTLRELVEDLQRLEGRNLEVVQMVQKRYKSERVSMCDAQGLRELIKETEGTFRTVAGYRLLKILDVRNRDILRDICNDALSDDPKGKDRSSLGSVRFCFSGGRHAISTFKERTIEEKVLVERRTIESPSTDLQAGFGDYIVKFVFRYHQMGWVHKALSCHNIIFLNEEGETPDLLDPYVVGFDFSRPASKGATMSEKISDRENQHNSYYFHPEYRAEKEFVERFDWHAVGVILFEIATWRSVRTFVAREQHPVRSDWALSHLLDNNHYCQTLQAKVGDTYTEVIHACLTATTPTTTTTPADEKASWDQQVEADLLEKMHLARNLRK
ncbi:hypothetical protein K458DRAFT_410788 [Lentithecium fluviatile CBS 122367]|uniref:Protein kinase domain-containing protein n=1 Tax=Lentithecium fluviatile CBS 122367 TaxID=1168545 RepID=A0A6G1ID62_9PLEO|nr:hypothetical protein K458DRAFT_410788 [Lentithecium fluviatile CBS 122367]